MDVTFRYVNPVKEDLIRSKDWGLLWAGNSKQGTYSVGSLAAEVGSALVMLSISAPPLEGHEAPIVEKVIEGEEVFDQKEECEEVFAQKKESMVIFGENDESRNSESMMSCRADVTEKKISDMAVDKKLTLQTSLKLVSAMKGSREKRGIHVEKLSVTWAADVYDPPVTSQSHAVTDDNQQGSKSNKKSYRNKNKHKAKPSCKSNNGKKKGSKTSQNSSKVASF